MANRKYNEQPIINELNLAGTAAATGVNRATSNEAVRRSNLQNIISSQMRGLAGARLQGQEMNNKYRAEEASTLNNLGQQIASSLFAADELYAQNKAMKSKFGAAAATQLGEGLSRFGINLNTAKQNSISMEVLNNLAAEYKWDPEQLKIIYNKLKEQNLIKE